MKWIPMIFADSEWIGFESTKKELISLYADFYNSIKSGYNMEDYMYSFVFKDGIYKAFFGEEIEDVKELIPISEARKAISILHEGPEVTVFWYNKWYKELIEEQMGKFRYLTKEEIEKYESDDFYEGLITYWG